MSTCALMSPSLRRLAGIQAVARYSPGGVGSCHRELVSIALKATSPRWSYSLIFGKIGVSSKRSTREADLDPDRTADVCGRRLLPVLHDSCRAQPHELVTWRGLEVRPLAARPAAQAGLEVFGDDVGARAVAKDLTLLEPDRPVAELRDRLHLV